MTAGRRLLVAGLLLGAIVRGLAMPLHGTGDTNVWKVWSFAAALDVTGMYGIGGTPPERRELQWHGMKMTVDYPPVTLYEMDLVGRLYYHLNERFDESPVLSAVIRLPGLVAEIALVAAFLFAARHRELEGAMTWGALAVWLNPAVILDGPVLGYLDAQMAVPLVAAVWAAWNRRPLVAGAAAAIAVLTKAQGIFALPLIAAVILIRSAPRWKAPLLATMSAGAVALAALLPFVLRGAWSNLMQAVGRLATHDMLSANAANVWWILTWWLRVTDVWTAWGWKAALFQKTSILAITRAVDLGYPNARIVGLVIVGLATAWACWRTRRATRAAEVFALASWCLYAYALFAAQVHENHQYPAVLMLAPAAALAVAYRGVFWLLSAEVALNLYLFYGFGEDWPPIVGRDITWIDSTVILSVLNVALFAWFTWILVRETRVSSHRGA